jgi:hypothetical protein
VALSIFLRALADLFLSIFSIVIILTRLFRQIPIAPKRLQDLSNDASEKRGSSVPVESHTEGNANPKDGHDDPMNPEASFIDPQSSADDINDTAGSNHDDDGDGAAFVDAATEKADALPSKRSSGGFADEDDLYDL